MKLEKFDEKSSSLLQSKVSNLTAFNIQKASFENLSGITTSLPLKFGVKKQEEQKEKRLDIVQFTAFN